jgi:predicted nucleotidyltransferase
MPHLMDSERVFAYPPVEEVRAPMSLCTQAIADLNDVLDDMRWSGVAVLYGSYARGTTTSRSDLDVLLVTDDRAAAGCLMRRGRGLGAFLEDRLSVSTMSEADLRKEQGSRPAFVDHLRTEGEVFNFSADASLQSVNAILDDRVGEEALNREADARTSAALKSVSLRRLNGSYVGALSRIYSAGKGVCMARLAAVDQSEYDWREVFTRFAGVWPAAARSATHLASLRPFYEHVRGTAALPSDARPQEYALVQASVHSLKDVTDVGRR